MQSSQEIIPQIVREIDRCLRAVVPAQTDAVAEAIDDAQRVFVAGAGRSGLAMQAFAMRLMHLGKTVHVVGNVATPAIGERDLLVIGSGSGSTESLRVMAGRAKAAGARLVLLTILPDSPIGRVSDVVLRIPAPSPKAKGAAQTVRSIQPMGSLFEQSLFLLCDALILVLMHKNEMSSEEMFTRHANLE